MSRRPRPSPRVIVSDTPEELDAATKAAQEHVSAHPPPDPRSVSDTIPPVVDIAGNISIQPYEVGQAIPPAADVREADQAQALGLSVEQYWALDPDKPQPEPDPAPILAGPLIAPDGGGDKAALDELNDARRKIYETQRDPEASVKPPPSLLPHHGIARYESRIRVVEAWQYHGRLVEAPSWIDKSWAAWGEYDEERKMDPGPALRVRTDGRIAEKMARVGDYVVKQEVTLVLGVEPDVQIDVWRKDEFEKFFLPSPPSAPTVPDENDDRKQA